MGVKKSEIFLKLVVFWNLQTNGSLRNWIDRSVLWDVWCLEKKYVLLIISTCILVWENWWQKAFGRKLRISFFCFRVTYTNGDSQWEKPVKVEVTSPGWETLPRTPGVPSRLFAIKTLSFGQAEGWPYNSGCVACCRYGGNDRGHPLYLVNLLRCHTHLELPGERKKNSWQHKHIHKLYIESLPLYMDPLIRNADGHLEIEQDGNAAGGFRHKISDFHSWMKSLKAAGWCALASPGINVRQNACAGRWGEESRNSTKSTLHEDLRLMKGSREEHKLNGPKIDGFASHLEGDSKGGSQGEFLKYMDANSFYSQRYELVNWGDGIWKQPINCLPQTRWWTGSDSRWGRFWRAGGEKMRGEENSGVIFTS